MSKPTSEEAQAETEHQERVFQVMLSSAINTIPKNEQQKATLLPLYHFIQDISQPGDQDPNEIAEDYLSLYGPETTYTVSKGEIEKFVPNIPLNQKSKLLELYGIDPLSSEDTKKKMFKFNPYKYILATMVNSVSFRDFTTRIKFAFRMYDLDDDGFITKEELINNLKFFSKENQFSLKDDAVEKIVEAIVAEIDKNGDGKIMFDEFEAFFSQKPNQNINLQQFRRDRVGSVFAKDNRSRRKKGTRAFTKARRATSKLKTLIHATKSSVTQAKKSCCPGMDSLRQRWAIEKSKIIWLFLWIAIQIGLWVYKFLWYYNRTEIVALGIAKACAICICFNMAFMLCLITKTINTCFRRIGLAGILPLNFNVYFHGMMGVMILALGFTHAVAHLSKDFVVLSTADEPSELNDLMDKIDRPHTFTEVKPYTYWLFQTIPGLTGIFILLLMTIMVPLARKNARRKNYERFWYTHMFWFPLLILLSMHGSEGFFDVWQFHWWVIFPGAILILEKVVMLFETCFSKKKIAHLEYLSSELIDLKIHRPKNFNYNAGQYALINIPEISSMQWHPFSLSSSPKDKENIGFHIAPVGDWTKKLKEIAIDCKKNGSSYPRIRVMGPYGAPAQHYGDYKHLMIFATGVGATPFSSVLSEYMENYKLYLKYAPSATGTRYFGTLASQDSKDFQTPKTPKPLTAEVPKSRFAPESAKKEEGEKNEEVAENNNKNEKDTANTDQVKIDIKDDIRNGVEQAEEKDQKIDKQNGIKAGDGTTKSKNQNRLTTDYDFQTEFTIQNQSIDEKSNLDQTYTIQKVPESEKVAAHEMKSSFVKDLQMLASYKGDDEIALKSPFQSPGRETNLPELPKESEKDQSPASQTPKGEESPNFQQRGQRFDYLSQQSRELTANMTEEEKALVEKYRKEASNIPKIEFYWVNRKPTSHQWMGKVLLDIQNNDPYRKILKTYMFFTSPQCKNDIRSFFLWTGLEILSKKGVEIPGLESFDMMHWGKPDWNSMFERKKLEVKKGKVGVFFCGNPFLAADIRKMCLKHSGDVSFEFHKEIF